MSFLTLQAQPAQVRVISFIFCMFKCSFKEISMIKIVILDQNKPNSLILKNKISKIQKSTIL